MLYVIVRHKVENYEKWKKFFDKNASVRKASGSQGGQVFRSKDNPNEVIVLMKWDNIENLRKYTSSPDLMEVMTKAGVIDKPDVYFIEEVDKPNS